MTSSKAGRSLRDVGGPRGRGVSRTPSSSSVVSMSPSRGGETGREPGGGGSRAGLLGRAWQAGSVAGCSLPQLAQWGGDTEQQPATE